MNQRIDELKAEAREALENLQALRDELRVQAHLGSMDIKQRWERLEEQFKQAQTAAKGASETSLQALRVAIQEFKDALEASRGTRHNRSASP